MEESHSPRELHGIKLLAYSIGYFGVYLSNLMSGVFVFQFYVYTINLDSTLVSIGVFLQLIFGAIFSIIFGVLIDNKKPGKYGKRKPYLLYLLPFWIFFCILTWLPPTTLYCPPDNSMFLPTAVYLWICLIIRSITVTSILIAFNSMYPEQSQTHENREKVSTISTLLVIISSILAMFLPLIVQSILLDPSNVKWWDLSGQTILFYIPAIGIIFAVFGLISILFTFFMMDEAFHELSSEIVFKKKSIKETIKQMKIPIRDGKYKNFLISQFFINFGSKIIGLVIFPFLTYVMLFVNEKYYIYIIISITCKFGWLYIWKKLMKKLKDIIKIYSICLFLTVIMSFLEFIFLIQILSFGFKIVLFIISYGTILGSLYIFALFGGPLTGALIDESARNININKRNQIISEISGAYSGTASFIGSIGMAMGTLLIGILLTGVNETNNIIITLSLASTSILYLFALVYIKRIKLDKN